MADLWPWSQGQEGTWLLQYCGHTLKSADSFLDDSLVPPRYCATAASAWSRVESGRNKIVVQLSHCSEKFLLCGCSVDGDGRVDLSQSLGL